MLLKIFGIRVGGLGGDYNLFQFWKVRGVNVDAYFDEEHFIKGRRMREVVGELIEQVSKIGLLKEKKNVNFKVRVWHMLVKLGKLMKRERRMTDVTLVLFKLDRMGVTQGPAKKEDHEVGEIDFLMDLEEKLKKEILTQELFEISILLSQGYSWSDIAEEYHYNFKEVLVIREKLREIYPMLSGG